MKTSQKIYIHTHLRVPLYCALYVLGGFFSVWWSITTGAFGVLESEKGEVKAIQEQLTASYLDNNDIAKGLRVLEEKILDSKIEVLTLEDNITEYENDIAVLQEKINTLFELLSPSKREIALIESEKQDLQSGMIQEGVKLVMVYLELGKLISKNSHNTSPSSLIYTFSAQKHEAIFDEIEKESLKKIEQESREKYLEMIYRWESAHKKQNTLRNEIQEKKDHYDKLSLERDKLQQQKEMVEELLFQARMEKDEYDELLTISRQQMMQSMVDAVQADEHLQELNKKLAEKEELKRLEPQRIARENALSIHGSAPLVESEKPKDIPTVDLSKLLQTEEAPSAPLSWPVYPERGISASFRDPGYYTRFKIPHNAIDIPVPQGTDLKASADGYVYKAVDNGLGYSYIIILHRNNLRTVYGHISHIAVKPGQMVEQGEIIGKTGGAPGTKGAGKMTTGAHLHFEVLENEVYRDPIEFLEAGVVEF